MKLTGTFTFDHDQQTVWDALMDTNAIALALPGVEALIPAEDQVDVWKANAKLSIAAISGSYTGIIRMSEQNPPHQYRLTVSGEGQQSIISGTALITLTYDDHEKKTLLTWEADANISGKLARVGQRVVKAAAIMMSNNFFQGIADQIFVVEPENPPEIEAEAKTLSALVAQFITTITVYLTRLTMLLRKPQQSGEQPTEPQEQPVEKEE